jgi:hypothetical protein
MSEHHTDQNHQSQHTQGAGHEGSDLRIGPIVWFLIILGFGTVVTFLLMVGLFDSYENRAKDAEGKSSPLAGERQKLPPEPRLQLAPKTTEQLEGKQPPNLRQDHPLQEMKSLREEENKKLSSYSWVDEKGGVVRIPIEEAKKLLLEKVKSKK